MSGALRTAIALVAASLAGCAAWSAAAHDPGALWKIVDQCVNTRSADYCACDAFAGTCCGSPRMPDSDAVWAETPEFVAIRDIKMCGCPAGFVSGLAMPRTRVTGIEDPRRPDGIWPFAWSVALGKIANAGEIGLVINPRGARTQNEMHVHIERLRPVGRAAIDATPDAAGHVHVEGAPPITALELATLDRVFSDAVARVGEAGIGDTGILVAARAGGGYRALLTDGTSPEVLTESRCSSAAAAH